MAKDSLARGAASAVFSAGQAERNDPIEFHGTVAEEPVECEHGVPVGRVCVLCSAGLVVVNEPRAVTDFSKYQPMNDRVLLRRIEEKNEKLIVEPDAFAQKPNKAEVLAVGEGMLIGGQLRPINLKPGDVVLYGEYNAEELDLEGEKLLLVSAFDVRLKIKA
jgi:chaperonin GroES